MHNWANQPLTGWYQSGPVFFGFQAEANQSQSQLESLGTEKPDQTRLSSTSFTIVLPFYCL